MSSQPSETFPLILLVWDDVHSRSDFLTEPGGGGGENTALMPVEAASRS